MNNQILIVCKGLPGSGKTTFSRKWVKENPKGRVRVNRDDIRSQLGPYWIPSREDLVTIIEDRMIISALINSYSVIVDATNFSVQTRYDKIAKIYGVKLEYKEFTTPRWLCIWRDIKRGLLGGRCVGYKVINNMYNRYIK